MEYYYINTDWDALGYTPHDKWIEHHHAFTAGDGSLRDYETFGVRAIGRLTPGDICLMYANGKGFIAAGEVIQPWDRIPHEGADRLVYLDTPYTEYRISVAWDLTCVDNPINAMDVLGWQPQGTLWCFTTTEPQAQRIFEEIKRRATEHNPREVGYR